MENTPVPGGRLRSNPNFRLYFAARVISQLGDQMYVFAVSWYVMDLTRSSFHMAALLAVNSLMVMAVSPFGGLISDRVSRKRVMVATDLIQGAVLLALIAILQGRPSIGVLYAATVILGLCSAVFSPAASAIVPGIVGRELVPGAVAAGQAAANLCTIAGMVIGGVLYRLVGITGILAVNAVSNLLAAAMESRIRAASAPAAAVGCTRAGGKPRRFAAETMDGLRQVRADGTVSAFLLINTVFSFVVLPIPMVYLPFFFMWSLAPRRCRRRSRRREAGPASSSVQPRRRACFAVIGPSRSSRADCWPFPRPLSCSSWCSGRGVFWAWGG